MTLATTSRTAAYFASRLEQVEHHLLLRSAPLKECNQHRQEGDCWGEQCLKHLDPVRKQRVNRSSKGIADVDCPLPASRELRSLIHAGPACRRKLAQPGSAIIAPGGEK
jgi:hypothetical protein